MAKQVYEESRLYRIRHSTAHVMAQAVMEMFPGETDIAIGPPIDDGFYYDFGLPRPLTPEDLEAIEARMKEIISGDHKGSTGRVMKVIPGKNRVIIEGLNLAYKQI